MLHDKMKKMMEKKKDGDKLSTNARNAKMSVLHDLKKQASDAMAGGLKGLKKVTVASDSSEGLTSGLDKAKQILGAGRDGYSEDMSKHNSDKLFGEGTAEEEASEPESERHAEEVAGEEGEMHAHHHSDMSEGSDAEEASESPEEEKHEDDGEEAPEFAHMDEHEVNKHLEKLMAHKKHMQSKK